MWFVFLADFPTIQCVQVFDCFQCLFFHSLLNLNLDTVVASRCIWDCFESHVLDFADSQWLEYQEQKDMNATWSSTVKLGGQIQSSMCLWWESSHHGQLPKHEVIVCHFQIRQSDLKTISSTFSFGKVTMKPSNREGLPSQSTWRWIPIPDTTQITGGAGIRRVVNWGNSETPLIKILPLYNWHLSFSSLPKIFDFFARLSRSETHTQTPDIHIYIQYTIFVSCWGDLCFPCILMASSIFQGGDGMCSWDAVDSFSNDAVKLRFTEDFGAENVCDTGPKVHNPNNWQVTNQFPVEIWDDMRVATCKDGNCCNCTSYLVQIVFGHEIFSLVWGVWILEAQLAIAQVKDKIILPDNLPVGEYLLSWRWDCYMADQIWSNCADVEITDSAIETTTPVSTSTTTSTTSIASTTSTTSPSSGCIDGELPTEWSQAGRFDCNYFRERGAAYSNPLAYCAHAAIRNTCCFCESALRQKHRALRRGHAKHLHQAALALIQNASKVRKSDPSELWEWTLRICIDCMDANFENWSLDEVGWSWVEYPSESSDLSDSIRCIHSILDRADSSDLDLFASWFVVGAFLWMWEGKFGKQKQKKQDWCYAEISKALIFVALFDFVRFVIFKVLFFPSSITLHLPRRPLGVAPIWDLNVYRSWRV